MKKFISSIMILFILFLVFSAFPAFALEGESPKISREQAVELVKKFFDTRIYDKFSMDYRETPEGAFWYLNWTTSKEPYASLYATVDADRGYIKHLSIYPGSDFGKGAILPKFSEDEAKNIAKGFATKLQPEEFKNTVLSPNSLPPVRPLIDLYARQYYFYFQRIHEGIPVVDNGFYITVDAFTGQVIDYSFEWYFGQLPSPAKILSKGDAEKIFLEKCGLNLIYKRYFDYEKRQPKIKLVYQIESPHSFFVDAYSGEVIQRGPDYRYPPYYGEAGAGDVNKQALTELTPQEQKELEDAKKLISKEKAIEIVKKYVEIPENYVQQYASLYEDYENPGRRLWSLSWEKRSDKPEDYGNINAQVDASSSELLSFYIYDSSRYTQDFRQNLNLEDAQKKADEFLKTVQPEKYGMVKLEKPVSQPPTSGEVREFGFNYVRQVNDIPFPDNGFSVTVDAETGKILSYYTRWTEASFPEPAGIISEGDAEKLFLEKIGLQLSYVPFYESGKSNYKLVYRITPFSSYTFDAFNMKPLDYAGNTIEEKPKIEFIDIKGHWAEKEIRLLCDLGIIEAESDKFGPDEKIKATEFLKMTLKATGGYPITGMAKPMPEYVNNSETQETVDQDEKIIETAVRLGLIKKGEVAKQSPISRELMAAVLVRAMGFEKVASINDIYIIKAKDASAVNPAYRGHAAIAMGLGLIRGISGNFLPQAVVTRAQAAVALVRFLVAER
ncbi:S-layer homology domain-containing protein [Thermovorax subterraneus]|nr:S-layer homology domain-containing protein [Thermovorax subterraneus]